MSLACFFLYSSMICSLHAFCCSLVHLIIHTLDEKTSVGMVDNTSSTSKSFTSTKRHDETDSFFPAAAAICCLSVNLSVREMPRSFSYPHSRKDQSHPQQPQHTYSRKNFLRSMVSHGYGEPHIARPSPRFLLLAAMPQEALTAHISSWRLENDALPSLAQMSHGELLEHAARIMCGVIKRQSEIDAAAARADALRQQELELGKAQRSKALHSLVRRR